MTLEALGPCIGPSLEMQYLLAILAALNTALAAWLANRRHLADKRERNGHGKAGRCAECHRIMRSRPRLDPNMDHDADD